MKILTPLLVCLLLIICSAPQESPELQEASDLTQSVVKLFKEGKFDEALPLAKRALQIRERLLPRTDPLITTSLSYLADVYIMKQDYGSAKETLQRVLQVQTERFGPDDVSLAPTLDRLAILHFRAGDASKAEEAYNRALTLKEKGIGTDNVHVAHTLFGLAQLYRARRDYDRSAAHYRRALMLYGRLSGVKSPEFERTREGFKCLILENRKPEAFEELERIVQRLDPPAFSPHRLEPILNGKALSLGRPNYPVAAREYRLSGTVVVKVEIDEAGKVINAYDMCQGVRYLSESAVKAARSSRFAPTMLAGKPVKVDGVIIYNFVYGSP